ncbi:MAG: sodium:proton antiporter [Thermonema sp.]|uniref:cation:proton antiporter n=1 Tax=Thermonema sp. TaxID=2231181 RepID=UPI0021DE1BDF|nr:cation:proton antiporter [Thermonema sp.]GIV40021.1 MAG: sodium:proton antiporter [Thermonema sp.]
MFLFELHLPLHEAVPVFALMMLIMLLAPMIFRRLGLPGMVGLILTGALVGPNGLHLLEREGSIALFGEVGLMYIMFLAGLEIDIFEFKRNRNKSLFFGSITFLIPQLAGFYAGKYLLGYSTASSLLLGSILGGHTLLAYPIVSRFGINKSRIVTIIIGGTVIAELLSLLMLAAVEGQGSDTSYWFWLRLGGLFAACTALILWGMPRLSRYFFNHGSQDGVAQYIFILTMAFSGGVLAELAGMEPIIGVFLAGLALNPQIPHRSVLMTRIEFVGNALFIPFFLVSVGMLVKFSGLFGNWHNVLVLLLILTIAIASKWLAAWLTQKLLRFSPNERQLMFGLSTARAAAALAVALVGFENQLLNESVLNATIIMIMVTGFVSSLFTEKTAKKLVEELGALPADMKRHNNHSHVRLLVPVANPQTADKLIQLALYLQPGQSSAPVYCLSILQSQRQEVSTAAIADRQEDILGKLSEYLSLQEGSIEVVTRIHEDIAGGIIRASQELMVSDVIIGWHGKRTARERIFGTIEDELIAHLEQTLWVCKLQRALNTFEQLILIIPPNAEWEEGFLHWLSLLHNLAKQLDLSIRMHCTHSTRFAVDKFRQGNKQAATVPLHVEVEPHENLQDIAYFTSAAGENNLFVFVCARRNSISDYPQLKDIDRLVLEHYKQQDCLLVYPKQTPTPGSLVEMRTTVEEEVTNLRSVDEAQVRSN